MLTPAAQTYSKAPDRYPSNAPIRALRSDGARVKCEHADGTTRWYLDCVNGMGAVILGHGDPAVTEAVLLQEARGVSFPLPTGLAGDVADQLLGMLMWENAEAVRFGKNGADVTGAAVKLARAVTGHTHIVMTSYHGHHPWSVFEPPMNAGVTGYEVDHSHRVPHGDAAAVADLCKRLQGEGGVACVIIEAVDSGDPVIPDPGYFEDLRWICNRYNCLFILDEMVTGFRTSTGGAAERWGIEPDLACYGKALANGFPLSAIVGPTETMRRFGSDVFFSTTHGGEAVSLAAGLATLQQIEVRSVPDRLEYAGSELVRTDLFRGYGARPFLNHDGEDHKEAVGQKLIEAGLLFQGYINFSEALAMEPVADTIAAALEATLLPTNTT